MVLCFDRPLPLSSRPAPLRRSATATTMSPEEARWRPAIDAFDPDHASDRNHRGSRMADSAMDTL